MTRWSGGYVATGDLVVTGTSARNKVWVSADGGRWDALAADVFGPQSIVVSVAPTADGVVALTLQSGAYSENGDKNEVYSWSVTGPWETWTSSDGRSWTAHPGPDFTVPRGMGAGDSTPTLVAGAGTGVVALVLDGQPLALSRDGIAWETVSLDAFPGGAAGWRPSGLVAFSPGFLAVGSTPTKSVALTSADGRTWTSTALPTACAPGSLTAGPLGLIVSFETGDPHTSMTNWCSSLDGRSWRALPTLYPIGYSQVNDECRGVCPNGVLIGDGDRFLAFRAYPRQVGWTSFDGRAWQPLAFSGSRPTGMTSPYVYQYEKILTPIGLLFVDLEHGTAWFGRPLT